MTKEIAGSLVFSLFLDGTYYGEDFDQKRTPRTINLFEKYKDNKTKILEFYFS